MDSYIRSLHHVTATVAGAQDDLDFYVGVLGQRLVKKTVNFDNPGVYHFYYGDEHGTPGTIMTTFPYAGMGVREGRRGVGQVTTTSFSAPAASLPFWRARLDAHQVPYTDEATAFGEDAILFVDPSGLILRIVGSDDDARAPWTGAGVPADKAIRGIHGVSLLVREPVTTVALVTELLDGTVIGEAEGVTRLGISGSAPGQIVELVQASDQPSAVNGVGTVHHVAFAAADDAQQLAVQAELRRRGVHVTDVLDRQYFHSIYFREPNGVLFEVATMPPGFAVDEPVAKLGRALKLPPWEEQRRTAIEAVLPAVNY
ncbi:MAG: VOC family protein [Proteobacteria bacterium]|nr:VOC family protein [Pseudomonadota bacterium]